MESQVIQAINMEVSVMETKKVPEQLLVKGLNEITEGKFIS
ncbi:hypothetical protein [Psychrobacillus sp. L3]